MTLGRFRLGFFLVACTALLASCTTTNLAGTVGGDLAPPDTETPVYEHRISANDRLSINVFPAKEMSMPAARVDATGSLLFPPTGVIVAQGKTVRELTDEVKQKLAACCLQNPQVIILLEETSSQQVTIDGAVTASGVYNLRGPTPLMQVLAMAKGPERSTANLKRIAVYRMTGGQRTGAIFNLEDIRAGKAQDPVIYGGDMIIVDSSAAKSAWRNVIGAVPFIGVFAAF